MPKFFISATNLFGGMAYMRGKDAHHLRVLRLRPGDNVIICDGKGMDYSCRIIASSDEEAQLEIIDSHVCKSEPNVDVSVYCGLPKGSDRAEYIVQKSVESGANRIYFFNSKYTIAKITEQEIEEFRQGKYKVLFASYSLVAEGLDVPMLENLVMASPVKNQRLVVQAIGRVQRPYKDKKIANVYDLIDDVSLLDKFTRRL